MNQHKIRIMAGQIKFLHDFFNMYEDAQIKVNVEQLNKVDMYIVVETALTEDETVRYVKEIFKKTPHGAALSYAIQLA
ncbi:hypothetical protein [Lysinibacillus piscis]|uniref:Uncharacterized protein n=1 Tax=Lysinibacillus piscis TaxID=2518931 RepID=A0ABQ5NMT7_9BACI|nr:hypothetical protein [Lysinibacillus sp. KH24]GLC89555.1 hypothetical protein LYSBPC_26820 [Lysinibacillus sp. KH24]